MLFASDLCAGLIGGLGVTPSGNIGEQGAIFESVSTLYLCVRVCNMHACMYSSDNLIYLAGLFKNLSAFEMFYRVLIFDSNNT